VAREHSAGSCVVTQRENGGRRAWSGVAERRKTVRGQLVSGPPMSLVVSMLFEWRCVKRMQYKREHKSHVAARDSSLKVGTMIISSIGGETGIVS
jgi:hypothetical protein